MTRPRYGLPTILLVPVILWALGYNALTMLGLDGLSVLVGYTLGMVVAHVAVYLTRAERQS